MQASLIVHQKAPNQAAELVITIAELFCADGAFLKDWRQSSFEEIKRALLNGWTLGALAHNCMLNMFRIDDNLSQREAGEPYVLWLKWGSSTDGDCLATLTFFNLTTHGSTVNA